MDRMAGSLERQQSSMTRTSVLVLQNFLSFLYSVSVTWIKLETFYL